MITNEHLKELYKHGVRVKISTHKNTSINYGINQNMRQMVGKEYFIKGDPANGIHINGFVWHHKDLEPIIDAGKSFGGIKEKVLLFDIKEIWFERKT